MQLVYLLWRDEVGTVVSAEMAIVTTILVLGLISGLTEVRNAFSRELEDVSNAVGAVNQTFSFEGLEAQKEPSGTKANTAGSIFDDDQDRGDIDDAPDQTDIVGNGMSDEDT